MMDEIDLFDVFGMIPEPTTPQLTNEEFEMLSRLEESPVTAESDAQFHLSDSKLHEPTPQSNYDIFKMIYAETSETHQHQGNLFYSSNQDMIDWNLILGEEEKVDDELKLHSSSKQTQENSIISHDSGFSEEVLSASDSSSSSLPIASEIVEPKYSNDQNVDQYFSTSIPNSTPDIYKECSSLCTNVTNEAATESVSARSTSIPNSTPDIYKECSSLSTNVTNEAATESVSARSDSNRPKLKIRQGVRKRHKQKVFDCSKCEYSTYFKESLDEHTFKTHIQPNQQYRQIQSKRNVTFKCELGDFESTEFSLVVNHKYEVHGVRSFKCARCEIETTSMLEYIMHINNYPTHIISPLGDRSNQDNTTRQTFSSDFANIGTIRRQIQSKENVLFKCELGDFESTDFSLLVNHKYEVHGVRNFQCTRCPMKTSSMLEYIAHMKLYPTHMNSPSINRPGQCNAGNRSTRNNNERKHIQQTLNGKGKQPVANISAIHNQSYTCKECTFSTPDMRTFVDHKFETHKHRWFKCPKCRVCSSSTDASMEHFRKNPSHMIPYVEEKTPDNHSDNLIIGPRREKQHRYKSDENLIIEVKKEGDKEKIVITPKSYFFKNRDKREIIFYCEVCKFNASTYKKVLLHRKTIHNLDMKCSGCSHTTSTICELKEHIVQNPTHMTEYVSCNLCNFGTYDQLVLISHKESEHFRNVQAASE